MKRAIISASRMVVIALACVVAASCGGDSDEAGGGSSSQGVLGTWVNGDLTYRFASGGRGDYYSGSDIWGDIRYNIEGNTVYMRITYQYRASKYIWRGENKGTYNPSDDTFYCDNRIYRREGKSK